MDDFKLDKPTPYYLQFYNQLKKMIFNGTFKPGERINETQLAKSFGVSRSPIREAMRLLEKDGLLKADDRNGFSITSLTAKDVDEIYKIRIPLEQLAVELVIDEADEKELAILEKQLEETEKAIHNGTEDTEIIHLNQNFHELLVDFSHNRHLKNLLEHVNDLIHFCRILNYTGDHRAETILSEHRKILEEVKKKNKEAAKQYVMAHFNHDCEHLKHVLEEGKEN
ncbi:GntR family transcriptional regulator [Bacillus spizizenii]|uniref:GntR family transcriptional regulator n=2 Tax=Bacillus spizizenii TaxID=96241 RepID=A0A9Q4H9C3_BACSC|nr:GntR family transcriptional regulator [Bacillus spizizenii]KFI04017.1 GntR family transcriptional regulator [Bacillus sp. BSC154]MDU7576671.1 GntR family transcriptional regulator [Bacillus subtilis]ADM36640.1 putative transcriptional regulator (GntR family) protein [Bacillus spizizenii str. W23]AJW86073.1 GntR family transcriptional regulator [Bacillus spizizenii]EFG91100.1 putative transcriptional regulator (GntR family) protein [Bacillus spizizenii ATCC 6633 = JCM 2499]